MALASVPSPDEIVRLYKSGDLLAELARPHQTGHGKSNLLAQHCVALHNKGDIALIALVKQPSFAALETHKFFNVFQLYADAIPDLDSEAAPLMECCKILIERAGSDGVSNLPNVAFRAWCHSNPGKAAGVIADARAGDDLAKRFATFALQAANDIGGAVDFVKVFSDDRRLAGMTALGGMVFPDGQSAQMAIATLEPFVADGNDDPVRLNALMAAFEVLKKHGDAGAAQRLVDSAAKASGPMTLHGLAVVVWLHHATLDSSTIRTALAALQSVDPQHLGIVREIDFGLRQLLGTKDEGLALDYVTTKLQDSQLKLENFPTVAHELAEGDAERLFRLIVRWFLSGSLALCNNVNDLVGLDEESAFNTTAAPLNLTPEQQVFVCRNAVGFLFIKPVVACSIIVAVLRADEKAITDTVADLLFDPILLSYGGDAKDYLEGIAKADTAYRAVRKALVKNKAFYAGMKAAGIVKELQPSERQRDVVRQMFHDEMQTARKRAEGKSLLLNLVQRSTILYGNRSRTYVTDGGGQQRAIEMELKPIGASFEMPRRDILDPVGLDYMLRVFRVMKLK